jgi:hypothetical protein
LVRSDLSSRRLVALTLIGACTFGLVACGSDKTDTKADPATTTTSAAGAETSTTAPAGSTSPDSAPGTTAAQIPFDEGVAQLQASIDGANGDTCKLYAVYSGDFRVEDPKTPDQVRKAIELTSSLFTAIADAAPADQAAAAAKIKSGVTAMTSSMESTNYSVESFGAGGYFNKDLRDGLQAFGTTAKDQCK